MRRNYGNPGRIELAAIPPGRPRSLAWDAFLYCLVLFTLAVGLGLILCAIGSLLWGML